MREMITREGGKISTLKTLSLRNSYRKERRDYIEESKMADTYYCIFC